MDCNHYDNWCEKEKRTCNNCYYERGDNMSDEEKIKQLENKIKKLEKEIEELKKPKYIIDFKTNKITKLTNDFISKDKIKAKIEELEIEQKNNRQDLKFAIDNLIFSKIDKISDKISINMSVRDILQSLLEKE